MTGEQLSAVLATTSEADWIAALRAACEASSQARVAEALRQADGYPSPAIINQVLGGRYGHPTDRLAALVRGVYLAATVPCPVLGDIRLDHCQAHQRAPFLAGSPLRVTLARACRSCNFRTSETR
jgi:hypothetical protein